LRLIDPKIAAEASKPIRRDSPADVPFTVIGLQPAHPAKVLGQQFSDRQQQAADDVHGRRREFRDGRYFGIPGEGERLFVSLLPVGLVKLPDFEAQLWDDDDEVRRRGRV